jgi:hypothetical protein
VTAGAGPGPGSGTVGKSNGREELNHERPNFKKGLPVSVLGDAAENAVWEPIRARTAAKSSGRRVRGSFCVLTPEMAEFGVLPTG